MVQAVVMSSPFPRDPDGEAVRTVLSNAPMQPKLKYVPLRPAGDLYGYRVVVGFGGWPPGGDTYCRNPELKPVPSSSGVTEMHAVLCVNTATISEAAARARRVDSPEDPMFQRLTTDVLVALIVSSRKLDIGTRR
jgi:hypothetical protein